MTLQLHNTWYVIPEDEPEVVSEVSVVKVVEEQQSINEEPEYVPFISSSPITDFPLWNSSTTEHIAQAPSPSPTVTTAPVTPSLPLARVIAPPLPVPNPAAQLAHHQQTAAIQSFVNLLGSGKPARKQRTQKKKKTSDPSSSSATSSSNNQNWKRLNKPRPNSNSSSSHDGSAGTTLTQFDTNTIQISRNVQQQAYTSSSVSISTSESNIGTVSVEQDAKKPQRAKKDKKKAKKNKANPKKKQKKQRRRAGKKHKK